MRAARFHGLEQPLCIEEVPYLPTKRGNPGRIVVRIGD